MTQEVVRSPAEGAAFDWRMSMASIERRGPFSDFSGYARTMVLLAGGGIRLRSAGVPDMLLRRPGDLIRFDGALAVQCDLLGGSCRDLNLMVARRLGDAAARVEFVSRHPVLQVTSGRTQVFFCVAGAASIAYGDAQTAVLQQWDAAVAEPGDACIRIEASDGASGVARDDARIFIAEIPGP